jgi:hypothetical protein
VPRQLKSPQEKKQLASTRDHFTGGYNSTRKFVKNWKRKKALVNREFRRKADQPLLKAKPGTPSDDVESVAAEITVESLQRSTLRKRLKKVGTVTVGEKVRSSLKKRRLAAGRRVQQKATHDRRFIETMAALRTLDDENLTDVLVRSWHPRKSFGVDEHSRIYSSLDPIDRAMMFFYDVSRGSAPEQAALCGNIELLGELERMIKRANRVLARKRLPTARKQLEQQALKAKLRSARTGTGD